jgi:aspartyl-tRNA(Asn)/glutamyl-tRNA(Gln) amidotransferase subunit B
MSSYDGLPGDWELVVGLEVHVELATATKLFSASPNRFGDEPNTNIDPVTLGLPGALPVLNEHAVELAMRVGAALNCTIQPCTFHRKNYFYPDMPKAYQVSQYDQPLNVDGYLDLPNGVRVGIERAHMEEDAGKSTHVGGSGGRVHGATASLIDLNRAGVPLVEIVSKPDIRSAEDARAYVSELRAILLAIGASDAKMEEGSMRVDANVSVHKPGTPFGTRCEIKNVNSVRSVGRAIEYEARRQIDLIESGDVVRQQTRHWDEGDGRTHTLRTKEDADDYRYFLEPDLVPLAPSEEWIDRGACGAADAARRAPCPPGRGHRAGRHERSGHQRGRARPGRLRAGRRRSRRQRRSRAGVREGSLRRAGRSPTVPAADLAAAHHCWRPNGKLTATQAKAVLAELVANGGGDAAAIAAAKGFEAIDTSELEGFVDAAIAAEPDAWAKFCAGDGKAMGALVGLVMKASQGKADGKLVTQLLNQKKG